MLIDRFKLRYLSFPQVQDYIDDGKDLVRVENMHINENYIKTPRTFYAISYLFSMNLVVLSQSSIKGFYLDSECNSILRFEGKVRPNYLKEARHSILTFYPNEVDEVHFASKFAGAINSSLQHLFCLQGDFSKYLNYALMIADQGEFNQSLIFPYPSKGIPRITRITFLEVFSGVNNARATIEPFFISQSTTLSYLVLPLKNETKWRVAGYKDKYFHSFPTSTPTHSVLATNSNLWPLPEPPENYQTVVYSQVYSHDKNAPFQCTLRIEFTGIIRAAYLNSEFLMSDSSIDPNIPKTVDSTFRGSFSPNDLSILTIIGYKLKVISNSWEFCQTTSSLSDIIPVFTSYAPGDDSFPSIDIHYPQAGPACDNDCQSCYNTVCYECAKETFLFQDACVDNCVVANFTIPTKLLACGSKQAQLALQKAGPIYNSTTKKLEISYELNPYQEADSILIVYYPYQARYANYPHISHSSSDPSLPEAAFSLHPFPSPLSVFEVTSEASIQSLNTAYNNSIFIIGYSLVNDSLLFAEVKPNNLLSAIFKEYRANFTGQTLDPLKRFFITLVLSCENTCRLIVEVEGNLTIRSNERTFVFFAATTQKKKYLLHRIFTGINYFNFELFGVKYFGMNFTGDYKIYALKDFIFDDQVQVPTTSNCSINGCQNCKSSDECISCQESYFLTLGKDQCTSACPSDSSKEERLCLCQGHSQCISPKFPICDTVSQLCMPCQTHQDCTYMFPTGGLCLENACYLAPQLTVFQDPNREKTIVLSFNKPMKINSQELQRLLRLSFNKADSSEFLYVVTQVSDRQFEIILETSRTFEPQLLTLKVTKPDEVQDFESFSITKDTYVIQIEEIYFSDRADKILTETTKGMGESIATAGLAGSGLLFLTQTNPTLTWFFINILQKYYYLLFINVEAPENLKVFLSAFSYGKLTFLPDATSSLIDGLNTQKKPSPKRFSENNIDGLFLINIGNILSLWLAALLGYLLIKLGKFFNRKFPKKITSFLRQTEQNFEWSIILRIWITTFMELAISSFLQLRSMDIHSFWQFISVILGVLGTTLSFAFPILVYYITRALPVSGFYRGRSYNSLIEGLKTIPEKCWNYTSIALLRRLLTCFVLVFLHDFPYIELFFLLLIDLVHLIFLLKNRPYEDSSEQLALAIDEALYFCIYILMAILHVMNRGHFRRDSKIMAGWAIIGCCMTGLVVTFLFSLIQQYQAILKIKKYIQEWCSGKRTDTRRWIKRRKNAERAFRAPRVRKVRIEQAILEDASSTSIKVHKILVNS